MTHCRHDRVNSWLDVQTGSVLAGEAAILKVPFASVVVPIVVPFTITVTPDMGNPVLSLTTPVTVLFPWAFEANPSSKKATDNIANANNCLNVRFMSSVF